MRVGVLTSSRADYGIYLPLLRKLHADERFNLSLIAFGTHLKQQFGFTLSQIQADGFSVPFTIDNLLDGDDVLTITRSYAKTVELFAEFWQSNKHHFDIVLCLGDRFEMAAAVNAGVPFGIKFAHFHAGETTLGAIDNVYRHQISLASELHFVSVEAFAERVHQLINRKDTTTVIGSLSLLNVNDIPFLSDDAFLEKWGIDLKLPSILVTVHPETVHFEKNATFAQEIKQSLQTLSTNYQIIVTLPNADTNGSVFRNMFYELKSEIQGIHLIENFGTQSYFTCMKKVSFLLGNTSSGIIEAASFGKYVLNIGDRQKGRFAPENVIHVPFDTTKIVEEAMQLKNKRFEGENPYFNKNAIELTLNTLLKNAAYVI